MSRFQRSSPALWVATAAVLALATVAGPTGALAQDAGSLADTLSRLERQLLSLERTVYRGDPPPQNTTPAPLQDSGFNNAAASQMQVRIDQFEDALRTLTGQVERATFELRQVSTRLDKLVADVDFRLRTLEQGGTPVADADAGGDGAGQSLIALEPGTNVPVAAPESGTFSTVETIGTLDESQLRAAGIDPSTVETTTTSTPLPAVQEASAGPATGAVSLPEGAPADQYNYARSFLMRRDFDSAEQAFRAFIDVNPDSELVGNAQYWLGETYYVRENYLEAARAFAEGYQNFPASGKAPDNLLKLGLALANLDRTDDACITLSRLSDEYPQAPANIRQRAEREHARLGCG